MSDAKNKEYRTLFIGLGGTGGRVLFELNKKMSDEQKAKAHMIYLDLDKGDADDIEMLGVPTVVVSSSDTVRDVIERLGPNDGVQNWIATDDNDKEFLSSKTDDGASQYRMKSRLCLANFLQNRNNKLAKLLTQLCKVGQQVSSETLRVMIVSSVAGGTGAGTFIQVALYIREFFRKNKHKDVSITGLFACPDLYVKTLGNKPGDRTNMENMYANAYAAIRELNAMNLAVSTGGLDKIAPGYGKSINIEIATRSEGKLFDPKDDKFTDNANNKPFNLLYFIDVANEEGGILSSLEQYYKVMADVVYTRLYSPLEESIRSGESNELGTHSKYPTAIYGSAGYGHIVYPYEDIIRYLATRKTCEEIGYTWISFEDSWNRFCRDQQSISTASGTIWQPTTDKRANHYIGDMETALKNRRSRIITLKSMMINADTDVNRADEYMAALDAALSSGDGMGDVADGVFGLVNDNELRTLRETLCNSYLASSSVSNPSNALQTLKSNVGLDRVNLDEYGRKLLKNVDGRALYVAATVIPQSEDAAKNAALEKDPMNLFYGLLSVGGKPVHPLAARYLLYQLRKGLQSKAASSTKESAELIIRQQIDSINKVFDKRPNDDKDVTIDVKLAELDKAFFLWKDAEASAALETYAKKLKKVISEVILVATNYYKAAVYTKLLEYVDALVAQYEGLFDNLEQYKQRLEQQTRQERVRNISSSDDRCIYVDASAEAKEYRYERDPMTHRALQDGDVEIAAAAGKGIYDALMLRVWENINSYKNQQALGYVEEKKEDTYSDLSGIFTSIIAIYSKVLKEKAPHLQVSVVDALVNQCCLEENITLRQIGEDPIKKRIIRNRFEETVSDMIAKSYPMLAYDPHNADTYYQSEDGNTETKSYMHIGMNPNVLDRLTILYGENDADQAKQAFEEVFAPSKGLTVSKHFDMYTITCFSAVHCLQPTQILKFREDYDGGYYYYYKKRLAMVASTGCMSFSPHLDKRWHLREAMPYISRCMEMEWHQKTVKAFIYEMLNRRFSFTTTSDGVKCFNYKQNASDAPALVAWPRNQLVTVGNISRLIEYLEEQDDRVERLNAEFDEMIENLMTVVVKYNESMQLYKSALTEHPSLKLLRENLCEAFEYVSSVAGTRKRVSKKKGDSATIQKYKAASRALGCDSSVENLMTGETDSENPMDAKKTLGGLLQVAWLVHKSEEQQDRDKDYGEAILDCALEIIEKLCRNVCGVRVAENTAAAEEYKDLYNSILEKFMEAFVKGQLVQRNQMDADKINDMNYYVFYRYLKVPESVSKTREHDWLLSKWVLK